MLIVYQPIIMHPIFNTFKIRKHILLLFIITGILTAYLGFADISLPHDKLIHFTMFFIMSFLFYWIIDINSIPNFSNHLRNITFVLCTLIGGIGSEFLQNYLSPTRTFDYYDILTNICGSVSAIILSDIYRYYYDKNNSEEQDVELGVI